MNVMGYKLFKGRWTDRETLEEEWNRNSNQIYERQKREMLFPFFFKAHLTMLMAAHYIQRQMRCHQLRRLVVVFSLRRPSVAQRAVCVEFFVHKVAVG